VQRRLSFLLFLSFLAVPILADDPAHWATVNGHRLYCETMGEGRPMLLLHGGGNSIHGSFAKQLDVFAKSYSIVAPEQIGHGHTPDLDGPITYSAMADDTAALLEQLHLKDVDVVGWSDGGIIALMLAARHPELVRRLAVSGVNFSLEGLPPDDLRQMREKDAANAGARTVDAKLNHMWLTSPTTADLSPALLGTIHKRVLVMAGDHDLIRLDHTIALYRALPDARLCILPGTQHGTFIQRPEWVNPIVLAFLAEP
jgi:pimeloyl-ACP methyl ester carboxylesterase